MLTRCINLCIVHSIAELRVIFRPLLDSETSESSRDTDFLVYAQSFKVVGNLLRPDPVTGCYALRRSLRTDGSRLGGVLPLGLLRMPVDVPPRFGPSADTRLTSKNSMEWSTEFWLNKFWDKEYYELF